LKDSQSELLSRVQKLKEVGLFVSLSLQLIITKMIEKQTCTCTKDEEINNLHNHVNSIIQKKLLFLRQEWQVDMDLQMKSCDQVA